MHAHHETVLPSCYRTKKRAAAYWEITAPRTGSPAISFETRGFPLPALRRGSALSRLYCFRAASSLAEPSSLFRIRTTSCYSPFMHLPEFT